MTIKNLLAIAAASILLAGCSEMKRALGLKHDDPDAPTETRLYGLVMGQSNAGSPFCPENGVAGFEEVIGHRNIRWYCHGEASTTLQDWQPTDAPYRRVLEDVGSQHIDFILWYQGENDAFDGGWHATYAAEFTKLTEIWRAKWANVPIVYAQLSTTTWSGMYRWDDVKAQQASINISNAKMIRTDDITEGGPTTGGDGIHYAAEGYRELGRRFARAYLELRRAMK